MTTLSKIFEEYVHYRTCAELTHSDTCLRNGILNIFKFLSSNAKYFAPIILLPLVVKIRKLNKRALDTVLNTLKYYVESVVIGTLTGYTIQLFICVFRNIFGKFPYSFFLFWPSIIGSFWVYVGPERVANLYQTSIYQCTIESLLLKRKNLVTRTIADSVLVQTLIFMCCSACILQAKQQQFYKGFWFLVPNPQLTRTQNAQMATGQCLTKQTNEQQPTSSTCAHTDANCSLYLLKGVRKYAAFGFTLDLLKILMVKVPAATASGGTLQKWLHKIRNFRPVSFAFLASYIGIYRSMHCYLNRRFTGTAGELNHLIGAFLAGSSYIFLPRHTLLAYGLILSTEILLKLFVHQQQAKQKPNAVLELLQKLPVRSMIYSVCLAHLVHIYVLRTKYVSSLGETIINGLTDNYAKRITIRLRAMQNTMKPIVKSVI